MLTLISTTFTIVFYQINSEVGEMIIGNSIKLSFDKVEFRHLKKKVSQIFKSLKKDLGKQT